MKTNYLQISLFILLIAFAFSCKKDKEVENTLKDAYFEVQGGSFVGKDFPSPSSSTNKPTIESFFGNSAILLGGSNPISIQTSSQLKHILVGVNGVTGYYTVQPTQMPSTTDHYMIILLFSPKIELESFVIVIALEGSDGLISKHEQIEVSTVEAGTGVLQISCSWDQKNDVDLHLIEPNGKKIYYGNSVSENGGKLDVDSNAACDIDNINNENITYDENAVVEIGTYTVLSHLWSNCGIESNTNYVITARYNGTLINPASGLNPYVGLFTPADDYGDYNEVMTFNISALKSMMPNETKLKLVYSKPPVNESIKVR